MRLCSVAASVPSQCEPISVGRGVANCLVAGKTIAAWREEAAWEAGFRAESDLAFHLNDNVFLSREALREVARDRHPRWIIANNERIGQVGSPSASDEQDLGVRDDVTIARYPWDLLGLHERLMASIKTGRMEGEVRAGAAIDGIAIVGKGSVILPGVYIEGVLLVGENTRIGPNAYIRGFTSIGDYCHLGQAVEIKNSIIYPRTFMAHLSYCGDSIVGEGVNFGAGTIISNFRHDGANHRSDVGGELIDTGRQKFGAVIGDGVHTGIHTSIYPGRKLWPGVTTKPGEVVSRDIRPRSG